MEFIQGLVPMVTPVWDIGLILPITDAVQLLNDLKAGQAKWNGVLDFSQEATLAKIRNRASAGRWAETMPLVDEALSKSLQPALVTAAGMLHFCNRDYRGARLRFSQLLSMDSEDNQSRLMLVLIDWLSGARESNFYRQELLEADWRSSAEFQGYLVRILEGGVTREAALKGWYNPAEKSWVYYISGLAAHRRGNTEEAINLLQEAALSSDPDAWESILSRAMIEDLRKEQRKVFATDDQWEKYAAQVERFEAVMRETVEIKKKRQAELAPLWARLADGMMPLEDRRAILEKAHEIDPENLTTLATLAYCTSALGRGRMHSTACGDFSKQKAA